MNRDFGDGECRRKGAGTIMLDSETTLAGVPAEVRDYKLGNRSALKWVLDPHKEKTPLALKGG